MKYNCIIENLDKQGVYQIKCVTSNKIYIGSTSTSFIKRLNHHLSMLRVNKHKNPYLQNAWNKYGEDDFEFSIIEICAKEYCLEREQYYIDQTCCTNVEIGFNINPLASGTTQFPPEVIEKRTKTMKKYLNVCSDFYKQIQNNELTIDDIPEKYKSLIESWINNIPWNKGKHYDSTDHLKVSHKISDKVKQVHKNNSENSRNLLPEIEVYDENGIFLGKWRSAKDLEEWSLTDNNNLPIKSRFKNDRMGIPKKMLQSVNINKSCKTGKPYKNLYFKYCPTNEQSLDESLNIGEALTCNDDGNTEA